MTTFGWILILWGGYLLFKHRKNLKGAKKLIIGVVTLICFGGIMLAAGNSNSHSTAPSKHATSKVTKHHHNKKAKESSSSSSSSKKEDTNDSSVESSSSDDSESSATLENSSSNNNATAPSNNGDMMTDQQGTIVGNSKSMIYHTPDQAGYRMSSANAVYFSSEAEAQAAGYRKALR